MFKLKFPADKKLYLGLGPLVVLLVIGSVVFLTPFSSSIPPGAFPIRINCFQNLKIFWRWFQMRRVPRVVLL